MAIAYNLDGVTVGTTELSIVSGTTTLQTITVVGKYWLVVDAFAMAKADEYRARIYEKGHSGGTKKVLYQATLQGVQTELFITVPLPLELGWDMTLQKIAGTDRAFDATIRT